MEKEFIPYTEALALKELGFDEPCLGFYYKLNNDFLLEIPILSYRENKNSIINETFDNNSDCVTAPTFSQAFRWFRKKYDIYVEISFNQKYENSKFGYIIRSKSSCLHTRDFPYKTYEEAELECLKKLIEIVKNNK